MKYNNQLFYVVIPLLVIVFPFIWYWVVGTNTMLNGESGIIENMTIFFLLISIGVCSHDQAIILPRSLKSALIPFLARIPRRTGYRGEMRYGLISDMRKLDEAVLTQTVQRYVALGLEPDDTLPPSRIPQPRLLVDETNRNRLINKRVDKDAAQKACCASHPHR